MSESSSKKHFRNLYRFVSICLQLADLADETEETPYTNAFGLGYAAFSGILRGGIKEIVDLKIDYYRAVESAKISRMSEKNARDFLQECFGDSEIDSINNADKERILALCNKIRQEWEENGE